MVRRFRYQQAPCHISAATSGSIWAVCGSDTVSLLESEMPGHPHPVMAIASPGNRLIPTANSIARVTGATPYLADSPAPPLTPFSDNALTPAGGDQPHNNLQPYLTLNFCIALQGVYPPRT